MAIYTMLTDTGLDKIAQTQGNGMYIEITRWVGAFDYQLNADYNADNIDYTNIANYTQTTDQYPNAQYGQPQETKYLNLGTSGQPNTVYWMGGAEPSFALSTWTAPSLDYLYTGVTYSSVGVSNLDEESQGSWDASLNVYPSDPIDGNWWTVSVAGTMDTRNADNTATVGVHYCVGDIMAYTNGVWVNGDSHTNRAHFRIPVSSSSYGETLLINKLGAYAVLRDNLGNIYDGPFLLGQVIIPNAQLIQAADTGAGIVDTLFVEFQIDPQSALINFDNIVFSSPNDYWQQLITPDGSYGLEYNGNVYIAQQLALDDLTPNIADSITDIGVSKLFVSTFNTINTAHPESEQTLPQLTLQYVDNSEETIARRIRTTFRTTDDGDCEIDMYGACSNEFGYYSIVPKTDEIFGLGNKTNRWRWLEASHNIDLYRGDYVVGEDGKISQDGEWYYIDNSSTTAKRSWRSSSTLKANDYQDLQIYGNVAEEWGFTSLRNNYMSKNTNLGMAYFGNTSVFVGPHYDSRDFVNGGAFKENYFYTYGNISNYIAETKDSNNAVTGTIEYPFCLRSTQDINLYTISTDNLSKYDVEHLATYGGYDALGVTMEIWNMIYYGTNQNSSNFVSKFTGIADGISTIYNSFFTEANYDLYGSKAVTIQDVRDDLFGENPNGQPTGTNVRGISRDILLTSSRYIYTFGDIVPMVDGLNNLGSWEHNFRDLHIDTIRGSSKNYTKYADDSDSRHVSIDGSLLPVMSYHDLGSVDHKWDTLYSTFIGSNAGIDKSLWVDTGYIKNLNVDILNVREIVVGNDLKITSNRIYNETGLTIGDPLDLSKATFYGKVFLDFSNQTKTIDVSIGHLGTSNISNSASATIDSGCKLRVNITYNITEINKLDITLFDGDIHLQTSGDDTWKKNVSSTMTVNGFMGAIKTAIEADPDLKLLPINWTALSENVSMASLSDSGDYTRSVSIQFDGSFSYDRLVFTIKNKTRDYGGNPNATVYYNGYIGFVEDK